MCAGAADADDGDDAGTDAAAAADDIDAFDAFDAIIQVVVILLGSRPHALQARISMTSHHSNQLTQPLTCKNIRSLTRPYMRAIMYTGLTGAVPLHSFGPSRPINLSHHVPSLVLRWCLTSL